MSDSQERPAPIDPEAADRRVLSAWVLTVGALADLALRKIRERDAAAHQATERALRAGGHLRFTTALSPAGLMVLTVALVLANGDALEVATVDLAGNFTLQ